MKMPDKGQAKAQAEINRKRKTRVPGVARAAHSDACSKRGRRYRDGLRAESVAVFMLRLKGYRILARRYKTPVGEIDIVARRGARLAFVEVKARDTIAGALQSLTPGMRGRIVRAGTHFLARHPDCAALVIGFDLVAVALPFYVRHIRDAWRPQALY